MTAPMDRRDSSVMAMALASKLAMDQDYLARPSGVMNSIFLSIASTASRMLVSAASSAVMAREGERWGVVDHVRYMIVVAVWIHVWGLRCLMDVFPSRRRPSPYAIGYEVPSMGRGLSMALVPCKVTGRSSVSTHGIGRSLSHMLGILNELPATSRKYEFVLVMADKVLNDNLQHGHPVLLDINRAVLSSAFSRTCDHLRRALRRSESCPPTWSSRVIRMLPMGPHLAGFYDNLRVCFANIVPAIKALRPESKFRRPLALTGSTVSTNEWLEAEKLAQELLWITNKMRASSAVGEAIVRWAFASGLATASLTAHPRVQGPLVKITAMFYREMVKGEREVPRQVRFGILALWLPLLCYASPGVTAPVLVGLERWDLERAIEDLVASLPLEEQEIILGNWLEDFAASESNWPNLQRSFERWCWQSRKFLLQ